jgi:hypothetical protein
LLYWSLKGDVPVTINRWTEHVRESRLASSVDFLQDGSRVAIGRADGIGTLRAFPSGERVFETLPANLISSLPVLAACELLFSKNGSVLMSCHELFVRIFSRDSMREHSRRVAAASAARARAWPIVEQLFGELAKRNLVIERLKASGMKPELQRAALNLARTRAGRRPHLHRSARGILIRADADPAETRRAHSIAQALWRYADVTAPRMLLLAMAQYRTRRYPAARRSLAKAERSAADVPETTKAFILAFQIMTEARTGHLAKARKLHAKLLRSPAAQGTVEPEIKALLAEVEATRAEAARKRAARKRAARRRTAKKPSGSP